MAWTSVWGVEKLHFDIIPPIRGHRNMPWERKSADTTKSRACCSICPWDDQPQLCQRLYSSAALAASAGISRAALSALPATIYPLTRAKCRSLEIETEFPQRYVPVYGLLTEHISNDGA